MRIVNARLGFANNSSSSHSMIIVSRDKYAKISTDSDGDGYGWNDFTLADAQSKLDYLANAVWCQLKEQGDETSAAVVVRDLFSIPGWIPTEYGLDHQSTFQLPASPNGDLIDVQFARAFAKWIQSEGVVVLGGNDNSDGHPMAAKGDAMPLGRESANPYVAKFDDLSGTWTLFNSSNGAKLRMAFGDGEALELEPIKPRKGGKPAKASAPDQPSGEPSKMGSPELVDIKITDYCDIGCAYCYQGSTVEGKHAKLEDIQLLARELFKAGVLEVAIGGGEPTRHPNFPEIMEAFSAHGIVANFTTRDLSFLDDGLLAERVLGSVKSIAISVSSLSQIEKAKAQWKKDNPYRSGTVSYQYVMGTASDAEFKKIIDHAVATGDSLTLLGYKDSGRGQQWREGEGKVIMLREGKVQNQSGSWMGLVREAMGKNQWARICIDTALARDCEAELAGAEIPRALWHKSEGLVSMYVDAVAMTMGRSSYEDASQMEAFGPGWLERFATWTPTSEESARSKPIVGARRG